MEVMANSREVFVVMRRHNPRSLVAELDFCTSPGPDRAKKDGIEPLGKGVTRVITDLGILARSGVGEELQLVAVHPGVTVDQVQEATGFELLLPEGDVPVTPRPTVEQVRLIREVIDPDEMRQREFRSR